VPLATSLHSGPHLAVALSRPDVRRAYESGASIVELRIDLMPEADLAELLAPPRPPVIVTNRAKREGGACDLPEGARIASLFRAALLGAEYVDIEHFAATLGVFEEIRRRGARVIVSRHDFAGMPDLPGWANALASTRADVVKVVGMANSVLDLAPVLATLRAAVRPTIALGMGEHGLASRIMALAYSRCFLTFASYGGLATAPGQVDLGVLRAEYRAETIGRRTRFIAVATDRTPSGTIAAVNRILAAARPDFVAVPVVLADVPIDIVTARLADAPIEAWVIGAEGDRLRCHSRIDDWAECACRIGDLALSAADGGPPA